MVYDPAWDMPRIGWRQQGSYEQGEIPPTSEPDGGTLICLPPINQDWLPFVLGCVDQMRNPSAWIVSDDDAMYAVLGRVDRLKQMLGGRARCFMYELRFTSECVLQYSVDAGTTWADVDGWDMHYPVCNPPQTEVQMTPDCHLQQSFDGGTTWGNIETWDAYFPNCVRENTPIIGLPPNPGGQLPNQLACSIAGYIAQNVILEGLSQAVTAIQDDLTLLSFGANVLNLIPEFILVRLAYDAFAVVYADVQGGTLSDYEAALTDSTLWADVQCAVYNAIEADGYVTPANFGAIVANIAGITYSHADVITVIHDYVVALGATGLAQLSQRAGLETGVDCSACAGSPGWCYTWDFTASAGPWVAADPPSSLWVAGVGWTGQYQAGEAPPAVDASIMVDIVPDSFVTGVAFSWRASAAEGGALRTCYGQLDGSSVVSGPFDGGAHPATTTSGIGMETTLDRVKITFRSEGSGSTIVIIDATIQGTGTNPFGSSNC